MIREARSRSPSSYKDKLLRQEGDSSEEDDSLDEDDDEKLPKNRWYVEDESQVPLVTEDDRGKYKEVPVDEDEFRS